MSKYSFLNGVYFVNVNSKEEPVQLANFNVAIKEEITVIQNNGPAEIYLTFDVNQNGKVIRSLMIPNIEFAQFHWVAKHVGFGASINTTDLPPSKAYHYLAEAIREFSDGYSRTTLYTRVGFVVTPGLDPKYIFSNGSVTATGISYIPETKLHDKLSFYSLPEFDPNQPDLKQEISTVFELLDISKTNKFIGLAPCLAAFRASTSLFMPIDTWFFFVGRTQTFKTTITQLCLAFYGPLQNANNLVSWESTEYSIVEIMLMAPNGVIGIDDFVCNQSSGRSQEFSDKAQNILRAAANGTFRSRRDMQGVGIEDKKRLNALLIATGEFAPTGVPESMHARGIYVPLNRGDIVQKTLTRFQEKARDGDLARVNVEFIRYLLRRRKKIAAKIETWCSEFRNRLHAEFNNSPRSAEQAVGMLVAWKLFRKFAVSNKAITEEQSDRYGDKVFRRLVQLITQQKDIYAPTVSSIFGESLLVALHEGRCHLIDHRVGGEPKCDYTARLGWMNGKARGLLLGWYNSKKEIIYVRGDLAVDDLMELVPLHYQQLFRKTPTTFWTQMKKEKAIVTSEDGRNGSRAKLFEAKCPAYQLTLKVAQ